MKEAGQKTQDFQAANQQRTEIRRLINETESRTQARKQEGGPAPTRPAVAGDVVELVKMGTQAEVISVGKDGTLQPRRAFSKSPPNRMRCGWWRTPPPGPKSSARSSPPGR